jgi:hypothetical protein
MVDVVLVPGEPINYILLSFLAKSLRDDLDADDYLWCLGDLLNYFIENLFEATQQSATSNAHLSSHQILP